MYTKDKWYLWLNLPVDGQMYWTGTDWTASPQKTMFFDTMERAIIEAEQKAVQTTKAEVEVRRCRVNIYG